MALTKSRVLITTITATGVSGDQNIADSYDTELYFKHTNGTGTISAGAVMNIQTRPAGSSVWFNQYTYVFSEVASDVFSHVVTLPRAAGEMRIDYTAPTGSTGHSLNLELAKVTAY